MASYTQANSALVAPRRLLLKYIEEATLATRKQQTEFGRRVRDARDAKGWKQKQLAKALSVEPMTVSRWERGVNLPDTDFLPLLAKNLERPISYFTDSISPPSLVAAEDARLRQVVREEVGEQIRRFEEMEARLLAAFDDLLRRDEDPPTGGSREEHA